MRVHLFLVVGAIALLALAVPSAASAATPWTPLVTASSSIASASAAQLVAGADGHITAAWLSSSEVVVATSTDDGETWSAEQVVSTGVSPSGAPHIAALGTQTVVVTWPRSDGSLLGSTSITGGSSWSAPYEIAPAGSDVTAPQLAADGTFAVATWHAFASPTLGVVVSTTRDGLTWSVPTPISDPTNNFEPQVAVAGSRATIVWYAFVTGANVIRSSSTTDAGVTWSSPVDVAPPEPNTYAPQLALAPDGTVTAAWVTTGTLRTATSIDGGLSWLPQRILTGTVTRWRIAAVNGTAVIVWTENSAAVASRTVDDGLTWSAPQQISTPGDVVIRADVVASGTEVTVLAAYDPGTGTVIGESTSSDGGLTFRPFARLSASSTVIDPTLALTNGGEAIAAWGTGSELVFTSRIAPPVTPAALPATGGEAAPWLLAGLLLVASGVAARRLARDRG